jgi:hypothetical protein
MKWYLLVRTTAINCLSGMAAKAFPATPYSFVKSSQKILKAPVSPLWLVTTRYMVLLMLMLGGAVSSLQAQQAAIVLEDSAYIKAVNERAGKIVATLPLNDDKKFKKVQDIVAQQYRSLNQVHEGSKARAGALKQNTSLSKEALAEALKKEDEDKMSKLKQQHDLYIAQLKKELSGEQIEQVKDGMTYRVLPITYTAYQDMIPTLTDAQKQQIYTWLQEAREYAMDAESSDKKHWWFGKYKGRINNYLSSVGYDLKKANEDWAKRRNAAKTASPQ